jgi:hypothetical protein
MDKDRQIRMLIPPFFLLASVVWEAHLSGDLWQYLHTTTAAADVASLKTVVSFLALVGVATLPVGYAIAVLTLCVLRCISFFHFFPQGTYEVPISKKAMSKISQRLNLSEGPQKSPLCAAAVFDHALLPSSIHQWVFRRWTTFNICTQCATALILSYFLGHALHIQSTCKWLLLVIGAIGIFIWQAVESWREAYRMFDFVVDLDVVMREASSAV